MVNYYVGWVNTSNVQNHWNLKRNSQHCVYDIELNQSHKIP